MDHPAPTSLETRTNGFLTDVTQQDSRIDGTVLLTARYSPDAYSDTLFDTLGIPCPPHILRAAVRRKTDYLSGRAIAQAAMTTLGIPPAPVTTAPSRAPIWPQGLTGSLSHARGRCACLLAPDMSHSLGVDTEALAQGKSLTAILSETLSARDRLTITQGPFPPATNATLAFSAKEALFKALSPRVGRFFGFDAAELRHTPTRNGLTLTLTTDLGPSLKTGQNFDLNVQVDESHVLTWLRVPMA